MTNIFVNVKSIGKRKPVFTPKPIDIPEDIQNLTQLIEAVVTSEVGEYNKRKSDKGLLRYLTEQQINDQAYIGKIGFSRIYNDKKPDLRKSIETAVRAFEDGIYMVVINNEEIKDKQTLIKLKDGDTVTFIRLTFLAGSLF